MITTQVQLPCPRIVRRGVKGFGVVPHTVRAGVRDTERGLREVVPWMPRGSEDRTLSICALNNHS